MLAAIKRDMRRRQPQSLPHLWLFTDERVSDDDLIAAIARLPRGSGIVFRHYSHTHIRRYALFRRIRSITRNRHIVMVNAGPRVGRADGTHIFARHLAHMKMGRARFSGLLSVSVHTAGAMVTARRASVDIIFLSPVFPTRSHPGAPTLGPMRFATLARLSRCPVIALGGMNAARYRRLKPLGAYGWAAIDALVTR